MRTFVAWHKMPEILYWTADDGIGDADSIFFVFFRRSALKNLFWPMVISGLVLVLIVIPGLLVCWHSRRIPVDRDRRRFLKRAAIYPAALAAAGTYGTQYERCHTIDRRYAIAAGDGLPSGYRIAQISDVHLDPFFSVEDLRQLLARIAAEAPDMLAVTGDLFDDERLNPAAAEVLDAYCASFPDGIWFCLGNHEHFRGLAAIKAMLAKTKVHVLYNEAEKVEGRGFWVAGVDYPMQREEFQRLKQEFLAKAVERIPQEERAGTILLAHHPEFIDNAAEEGLALVLSGHTHGGQIGLLGVSLFPVFKYMRGFVRIGQTLGYVHCGNGSWFPCRIGCPPEIAYFIIK